MKQKTKELIKNRIISYGWIMFLSLIIILGFVSMSQGKICEDIIESTSDGCLMVTPTVTNCANFNYNIYNNESTLIESGNLTIFNTGTDIYSFNFTQSTGSYIVELCDGTTREIQVKDTELNNNIYYFYVIAFLLMIALLVMGFSSQNIWLVILAGMLSITLAVSIFFNGFPSIDNEFLKNSAVIVLAGMGMYFVIAPYLEENQ